MAIAHHSLLVAFAASCAAAGLCGCGGSQSSATGASGAELASAPVDVTEPTALHISATTIGPSGRATPYGISGGDPVAQLEGPTLDPTYAYTPDNPARVGTHSEEGEMAFLNALWGPRGQPVYYQRIGSCCSRPGSLGPLDAFVVTYDGLEGDPLVIYIDVYDQEALYVPVGLTSAAPVLMPSP